MARLSIHQRAERFARVRVVADRFGENVARAGERGFSVRNLAGKVFLCLGKHVAAHRLKANEHRKRLETAFLRNRRARAALRAERAIEILQLRERLCGFDFLLQRVGQEILIGDAAQDFFAAFVQTAQVFEPFGKRAQNSVVQRTVRLLAVARDEWNGISGVDQIDDRLRLGSANAELVG